MFVCNVMCVCLFVCVCLYVLNRLYVRRRVCLKMDLTCIFCIVFVGRKVWYIGVHVTLFAFGCHALVVVLE